MKMSFMQTVDALMMARRIYEQAWKEQEAKIDSITEERFWDILPLYRQEVIYFCLRLGRKTEDAAWELCRKVLCEQIKDSNITVDEMVAFARKWDELKNKLYTPLFHIVKDRSDDAYGDLLDNLLLLGEDFFELTVDGQHAPHNWESQAQQWVDVELKVEGSLIAPRTIRRFILRGENYHGMSLRDASKKAYRLHVEQKLNDVQEALEQGKL